jgi:hypothetical protein
MPTGGVHPDVAPELLVLPALLLVPELLALALTPPVPAPFVLDPLALALTGAPPPLPAGAPPLPDAPPLTEACPAPQPHPSVTRTPTTRAHARRDMGTSVRASSGWSHISWHM